MGTIVKPHAASDGAPARPDRVNAMLDTIYNEFNGNIDWDNIKAALINAANGFLKLDASGLVPTAQLPTTIVPAGVIVMWAGLLSAIPSGWSLCDGDGGTPDLRDKFIYGWSDGVDPGGTGGAATHTHTYSDLPAHTHGVGTLATASDGAHTHTYTRPTHGSGVSALEGVSDDAWQTLATSSGGAHTHTLTGSSASAGVANPETDAGSTLPPYYKLAFIQKD